jgi:PKD repeat protein
MRGAFGMASKVERWQVARGKSRGQQVIAARGRLDGLQASGQPNRIGSPARRASRPAATNGAVARCVRMNFARWSVAGAVAAWLAGAGAAPGVTNVLASVSPSSAPAGATNLLVTFTMSPTPPPPPTNVPISAATIGTVAGMSLARPSQSVVTGRFSIPGSEPPGAKDVRITFPGGNFVAVLSHGFAVTDSGVLLAGFTASPILGPAPLTVLFTDATAGTVTNRLWDFGDGGTSAERNPAHTYAAPGSYPVRLTVWGPLGSNTLSRAGLITVIAAADGAYTVVDTGQTNFYGNTAPIAPPIPGQPFYGQDAHCSGPQPAYTNNGDGTVTDLRTGLTWVQARGEKVSWAAAVSNAAACTEGGYADWRMPTIKELYSLILFSGENGQGFTSTAGYVPFIDTNHFGFAYGSGVGSERVIDGQDWSATRYVSTIMNGDDAIFGVNFADGRIKGYPEEVFDTGTASRVANRMYVRYVRGNPAYGINRFADRGDGTISDRATGLMWSRDDSGAGMNWSNALAWVEARNAAGHLGRSDWRMPNAKELHSILDYTRSPGTTASAAIDPAFRCTAITNEGGALDYPFFWTGTTLLDGTPQASGVYLCFGRALGWMQIPPDSGTWQLLDVHGAGAQRSDFKAGDPSSYPHGRGPQGDVVRIDNFVRLVRDEPPSAAWRFAFVGDTHTPLSGIPAEIASSVVAEGARFLVVGGDLVQAGAGSSPTAMRSQLELWRDAMAPLHANGIGVYVIRGNHEDDVTNNLAVWNDFFSGPYAMPANGPAGESNLTWSLAYSNALLVGLDTYAAIHRVNQLWLDGQLAANTRPHVFVIGHEPAFKAFHTDNLDDHPAERNTFWQSLAAAGAKVYLCGHDHLLNLARIDDGDGKSSNDLHQFIVGTGGSTNWPPVSFSYNGDNAPYAPVNVCNVTGTYGYLLVEVSGSGPADLGVTMTWKRRTYDTNSASYIYAATTNALAYMAADPAADSVGDGLPDGWRRWYFGGDGTTTGAVSCAACDPDGDGLDNAAEYGADTDPTDPASRLALTAIAPEAGGARIAWTGGAAAWQFVEFARGAAAAEGEWTPLATNAPAAGASNSLIHAGAPEADALLYRIRAHR